MSDVNNKPLNPCSKQPSTLPLENIIPSLKEILKSNCRFTNFSFKIIPCTHMSE